jgi:putative oxidoreductase
MEYGILLLRLVLGLTLAAHGAQKLFGWWNGPGLQGIHEWLGSMRFRGGWAPAAGLVSAEFGGGLLLALGLFTPFAAFLVVAAMVVAIRVAHWRNGFFNGNGGWEFNLLIVAASTALAATGPGRFSLDRAFGWDGHWSGLWWGVGVLVAGALAGAFMLTGGRRPETPAVAECDSGLRPA